MEEESKGSWAVRCRGPRAPTWASAAEFELASTPAGLHPCFYAGRGMWEWTGFSLHFKKMTLGSMGRRNWNGAGGLEAKRPVRGRFWKSRPQMQVLKTGDKQSKGVRLKTQSWLLDWMQGMREQDLGEQDSDFCSWAGGNAAYWDERLSGGCGDVKPKHRALCLDTIMESCQWMTKEQLIFITHFTLPVRV